MNPEIRELLEIKSDNEDKITQSNQNVLIHTLIRLGVLVVITIGIINAADLGRGSDIFGYLLSIVIFHGVWFIYIIIETIILNSNKKAKLRNVNLIFIGIILLVYLPVFIIIFGE